MKHLISVPPRSIPFFHSVTGLAADDWFVASDPAGKRVGSGGSTAHLLAALWKGSLNFYDWLRPERRVIIYAG